MGTLANGEHPNEMFQNVVFHQGLHCLVFTKIKSIIIEGNTVLFGNNNVTPQFVQWTIFTVSNLMENSIGTQSINP